MDVIEKMETEMKEITKEKVKEYINLWKRYDSAYFWTPYDLAFQRRKAEEENSYHMEFSFNGHNYIMDISMQQSTKNVYVRRELRKDGKKVTIRELTKIINR
jgi:hypothetical protein